MMKKLFILLLCISLALLAGCAAESDTIAVIDPTGAASLEPAVEGEAVSIVLSGDRAQIGGTGAALQNGELLISKAGVYCLSGALDGCITIDCAGDVELILNGVSISGSIWALYARDCASLTLTLSGENTLRQSAPADENGVALESKSAVTVRGSGTLSLEAAGAGLRCSDALTLTGGTVNVTAADLGVKAKGDGIVTLSGGALNVSAGTDALKGETVTLCGGTATLAAGERGVNAVDFTLSSGTLTVTCGGDGIKTDSLLTVSGGTVTIDSGFDGLQSDGDVVISGGTLDILCAGGGGNAIRRVDSGGMGGPGFGFGSASTETYDLPEESCKAIKADGAIAISGGTLTLNSADDCIHAAGMVEIADCTLDICSSDDAIHSDTDLIIQSGVVAISDCFEGIEAGTVTINGGDVDIYSVNDGINASSGDGGFGNSAVFTMNGGEVDIFVTGTTSNLGDGIDSNGAIYINGGRITSSTDGSTMENGIDSGGSFVVTGGILAASGNSGMQESASTGSTQCAAVLTPSGGIAAGTECVITDAQGNVVMTYTPYRWASCLVVSHPDFVLGETYTLTAGSTTKTFTFSSVSYSERGFGFGGPGGPGGPGGQPF